MAKKVIWWGRSDSDYSRNRIVRHLFRSLGWEIVDFYPVLSCLADRQAHISALPKADLIWVPCFRQRDIAAAARWAKKHAIVLVFDPLISAYDKQVLERKKFSASSWRAKRVLEKERQQFRKADYLVADTLQHARFFNETLQFPDSRISILPVGAEETVFTFKPFRAPVTLPLTVLFFGSFLALQGPEVIAEAIRIYRGPAVNWRFIGHGPLLARTQSLLSDRDEVEFIEWVDYTQLADEIARADICLGIFGQTEKTLRVVPNKFYQTIACGRPIVTCESAAYPESLRRQENSGIFWVPPANARALAEKINMLADNPAGLPVAGGHAYETYQALFSESVLRAQFESWLASISS